MIPQRMYYENWCNIKVYVYQDEIYESTNIVEKNTSTSLDIGVLVNDESTYNSINLLWPSDVIWRHISGNKLAQVMAWTMLTYIDKV